MNDPQTTTKNLKRQTTFSGGLEGTLDVIAKAVLAVTVLHAAVVLAATAGKAWTGVPSMLVAGIVSWVTLRALAEILRLLKKGAGLPFGGKISQADEHVEEVAFCTQCGALLHSETRCESCGRMLEGVSAGQD